MGKKIKPFREWKKWKTRKMLAKGIDVSEINYREWKRRYNLGKRLKNIPHKNMRGIKPTKDIKEKRTKAVLKFYSTKIGKQIRKEAGHKISIAFNSNPKIIRKLKRTGKKTALRLLKEGKHNFQNPKIRKKNAKRMSGNRNPSKRPEVRKKISRAKKLYWSDPKKREERSNKFKGRRAVWWDGKNNPNWKGGCSSNGYPPLFLNPRYRELVRERFGRKCMICFHPEFGLNGNGKKLFVHHINYKRTDCRFNNLIPLHNSCHSRTNFKDNANQWEKYFRNIMKTLTN